MAVGEQNPREPRDFYHLVRPNTTIWIGRVLPLLTWIYFPLSAIAKFAGVETDIDPVAEQGFIASAVAILLHALMLSGIMLSPSFKAGIFQYAQRKHVDEFELRLVEKARLFAYRIMGVALLCIMFLSPEKGPIADWTGGPTIAGLQLAIVLLIIILFTVPVAYFHWALKTVPVDENIRPDPPFVSDEDVAKGFWRR